MKNLWPLLLLGAVGYAFYSGMFADMMPEAPHSNGTAGGPAVVRQVEQMPDMMHDMAGGSGGGCGAEKRERRGGDQARPLADFARKSRGNTDD